MEITVFAHDINDYYTDDIEQVYGEIDEYLSHFSDEEIEDSEEMSRDDYRDELLEGLPVITRLTQVAFKEKVKEWAEDHGTTIDAMVRGYVDEGYDRFVVAHGIGYDWIDADILGGNGSGEMRRKFGEWLGWDYFQFLDV